MPKRGQGINLDVNGSFIMRITDMIGNPVTEHKEAKILFKLRHRVYGIDFATKTIMDVESENTPARYKFTLEVGENAEYEFSEWEG